MGTFFAGTLSAQNITVNSTGGTLTQNYATLALATTAINAGTHTGVINIVVNSSTTETAQSTINFSGSGAASYTSLTIKPAVGVTATISSSTLPVGAAILKLNGADNVTIDGSNAVGGTTRDLTFTSMTTGTTASGILWITAAAAGNGSNNLVIKNCKVIGPGSPTANNMLGIVQCATAAVGITLPAAACNNVTIQNNLISDVNQGMAVIGFNSLPLDQNWSINSNTITNVGARGIQFLFKGTSSVNGNSVSNVIYSTASFIAGIDITNGNQNINVFNNTVTNVNNTNPTWGCHGIRISNPGLSGINVYNNYISGVRSSSGFTGTAVADNGYGIAIDNTGTGHNIYYNTIVMDIDQGAGSLTAGVYVSSSVTGAGAVNLVNNNIINRQTSGVTNRVAIFAGGANTVFGTINNNNYYSTSGMLGLIGGTPRNNIAAIQAGFGGNANSMSLNPTFVSSSDFHLQSILANQTLQSGVTVGSPTITTDFDGNTRAATPLIGADEVYIPSALTLTPPPASASGSNVFVNGVNIIDNIGIPLAGPNVPMIYFRKNGGAWFSASGTLASGTATNSTWDFTILASTLGGLNAGDIVEYYIVAQNNVNTVGASPSAGFSATSVSSITTPPTSPYTFTVASLPTVASLSASPNPLCVGTPLTLTAGAVTGTGTLVSYNWTGPNGFSTTTTSNTVTFTPLTTLATGQYSVSVTYTGAGNTSGFATTNVTVGGSLPAISTSGTVCVNSTTTLNNTTAGGTWSSSASGVATIGSSNGVAFGVFAGTATITYQVGACITTTILTVNPLPVGNTGVLSVCVGSVTSLSNATVPAGTWSSSNPAVGSIAVNTVGDVTGVAAGTARISYIIPTGCYTTSVVTVSSIPAAITGLIEVCEGATTSVSSTTPGGTWSSSSPSNGTVSSTGSIATVGGISNGTMTISYILSTGCYRTFDMTVNVTPTVSATPSAVTVCVGSSVPLTGTPTGGTWSVNPAFATVGITSGILTGVSSVNGTGVTYTLPTGCRSATVATVNPVPSISSAMAPLCVGASSSQSANIAGGDWISSNPGVADVTIGTGFVTGISAGTADISYILPTGCYKIKVATINAVPTAITGGTSVCAAQTLALASTPTGGTWASSTPGAGTINATTGLLTGIAGGTTNITYTVSYAGPTSCRTILQVTVDPQPATITGTGKACPGTTTTLNSTTSGGTWSTNNALIADILTPSVGVVTGVGAGTTHITYTIGAGCFRTFIVTINPLPAPTTGTLAICPTVVTTLNSTTGGGTWSSSNTAVGTINVSSGVATGLTAGTTNITYRLSSTGCLTVTELTVNPTPAVITGASVICVGSTTPLADADGGGTWVSSNTLVGTIDGSGNVTGVNPGTTVITYTLPTTCRRTTVLTVNTTPSTMTGTMVVCEGSSTNLISTPGGGTWTSSNTAVGTVGSTTGVVAGISAGTTDITYSLGGVTGCLTISTVTVNPRPQPITGFPSVCIGSITTLSSITPLGAWSSGAPTIASVDASGNVLGVLNGTAPISYTLSTGCARVLNVVVNALPFAINGADVVCVGSNATLTTASSGGTWSTDNSMLATITSGGVLTGVGAGVVTVSYILPTGCFRTKSMTVNPLPAAISTTPVLVCVGSSTTLTSSGIGTWTSSAPTVGSIDPVSGVLTGLVAGATTISYVNANGCRVTTIATVQARPNAITGTMVICEGASSTLTSAPAGGSWSTLDNTIADILPGTGYMTGTGPGSTDITYTAPNGCSRSVTVTVNPLPGVIGGSTHEVCVGSAITLTNPVSGGTWSASPVTVATVNVTSGLVQGISAGTVFITYKLSTGCYTTDIVTVDPLPSAITGSAGVCMGFTTVLSSLTLGGTWASGNMGVATVDPLGVVTSVAPGTATISYTSLAGCTALKTVTVHPLPASISGSTSVCTGSLTNYSNTSVPGTWSSSNAAVGTISTSGVLNAMSAGTTAISYIMNTGCYSVSVVTVNSLPATITGVALLCSGGNTSTLSSISTPGSWTSNNPTVASIDLMTGVVTSGNVGTATISYTNTNGCMTTRVVSVVLTPSPIVGLGHVCQGSSIAMTSSPNGGTWSSSIPSVGTISTTGSFTGISAGVTTISYVTANGCGRSTTATVDPTATLTSGPAMTCVGASTTLTYDVSGGSWISSNTSVATVGLTTGVVTGVNAGGANITYILSSGCKTITAVTVNAQPANNTGTAVVCLGLSTTLSNTTPGIVWSSANTGIATVGSATGIVVGTGVGNVDVTATNPLTGCTRVTTVTVNALPSAITGTFSMCIGNTTTLASTPIGGTWTSNTTAVATVGVTSGVVTGVTDGTSTITYKLSTGCVATRVVSVLPAPAAITGINTVCVNGTTTYFTPTTGGVWSSSNNAIAQVGTGGVVTGFSPGVANISYILATTCFVTKTVTVLPMVSPIAGVTNVCEGSTTNLSTLTPGGTWSSSNTLVALVGTTTGVVTGQAAGTSIITYTAPTGCTDTALVTVNAVPSAIMGIPNMCQGATTTLSNLSVPGTWSSGNPIIASVDASSGVVTGHGVGTARITYTIASGCRTTLIVSVTPLPGAITGSPQVCEGGTTNLGIGATGGTWSSVDETIAIVSSTGVVSGVAAGSTTISYTLPTGCASSIVVTVNAVPDPIVGVPEVCLGSTTTLTATPSGGVWTSSNMTVATIGVASGLLTGTGVGTSIITYTLATGCRAFTIATVHILPGAITGVTNICQGGSTTLHNSVPGGIWSSDFLSVAYVDPSTGEVTGNSIGVDTIRYTLTGGCSTKITITVNEAPTAITGDFEICLGETTTLTPPAVGGTWSSSNTSVATIGASSGIVTSHAAGSTEISYTLGAGCMVHTAFVVDPSPSTIIGPHEVCSGQSITLINTVTGGTWTSTNSSVAIVDGTTGVVTGGASGTATIVYQLPGSCFAEFIVTVNSLPAPIAGVDSLCQGSSTNYASVPTGGIWTSSTPLVAPVNLVTGEVTGISVGISTISYTLLGTGCYRTKNVTVNPVPNPITGTFNTCIGATTLLTTSTIGGTWTSSNTTVALVGSTTGVVQGLSAGTATIMNILPTGCSASALIVVNPLPDNITGPSDICVGSTATLASATPFGSWASSNPSVVTIDAASGAATGIVSGNATITYTLFATGCYVIKQVTVQPLPPAITGVQYLCLGSISFVTNPIPGGTWSSSNTANVTVDGFGNVTGTGVGTATITYELGTACYVTRLLTVEPTLNPITGVSNVCAGATITLSNSYFGGSWSSSAPGIAIVGTSGVVTGVAAGPVTISYATPLAHCYVTKDVTVDPVPGVIAGADNVCVGATTNLTNSTPGGVWESSDDAVATVNSGGMVTGVSANTVLISYTVGTGCSAMITFTVKPLAEAGTIGGATEVCVGSTIPLTSTGDVGGTWSSANTTIATVGTSGVVTGVAIGTTTITYIVENDCSVDTATYNVLVKPLPDAGVLSAGTAGLCINYTTNITSTITGGVWTSSNPAIASINAVGAVTALSAGTVTISYTMTTDCGVDVATINVTVFTMAPHTSISIHPDTVLCANAMFRNFGAEVAPGSGLTFTWTAINAEVYAQSQGNRQNALVNFPYAGTATVRLTTAIVSTGCFVIDSFTAQVSADTAFTPEVKYYQREFICTDNTSTRYQWGYDDATTLDSTRIFGAIQQSYYQPNPDFVNRRYWVISEHNGCFQKTYYNVPTEVDTKDMGTVDVRLFPNPADTRVNIEVRGLTMSDDISVKMIDMLGREMQAVTLVNGKGSIDVSNLASGMYSVVFFNNGAKVTAKTFVKN